MRFNFLDFRLEDGLNGVNKGEQSCVFDSLSLFDGDDKAAVRVVCGDWSRGLDLLEYVAQADRVRFQFVTDFSENFRGFKIEVSGARFLLKRCSLNWLLDTMERKFLLCRPPL